MEQLIYKGPEKEVDEKERKRGRETKKGQNIRQKLMSIRKEEREKEVKTQEDKEE